MSRSSFAETIGDALYFDHKNRDYVSYSKKSRLIPDIKNVIFNPPATIIFWGDGTKTVVKCSEYDDFDPEKGMAMAIAKKAIGEGNNYYPEIKKWIKEYEDDHPVIDIRLPNLFSKIGESISRGFHDGLLSINNNIGNDVDSELNK